MVSAHVFKGIKATSICTSHFVELHKLLSVTLQQGEQMFLAITKVYAEQRDPKVLQHCDPCKKPTGEPWKKYYACFLEAKKSGVDRCLRGVMISKCSLSS